LSSKYRADWLLPVSGEPIAGGAITIDAGRIVDVGPSSGADTIDLGRVALLPSLVNVHTHLELSYLHAAIPPADSFTDWVRALLTLRRQEPDPVAPRILDAARVAIAAARGSGTGLVGEVSNSLATVPLLRDAALPAHVFLELIGFNTPDPVGAVAAARQRIDAVVGEGVRASLAPHAPYSVSPALFTAIRADLDEHDSPVSTVHLGESGEEVEFLRRGSGPWRTLLEQLGAWAPEWKAPDSSPVQYLESLGFLDSRVLAVHGVQFSGEDLGRLRSLDVTVVSCPRSNQHVGVGSPPLEAFYAMDVDVAFGTDSLASVADLNLFSELAEARRLAPRVSARTLIESATLTGAAALGFDEEFGSLEAGKRASVIAVRLPEGVTDVEEYLVSGVVPGDITWIESGEDRA
jgi:cytosine/adenosine deaminase-related metal-dependent hydrolase